MGGISVLFLMGVVPFVYIMYLIVLVFIILFLVISYTFDSISTMCISKNLNYNYKLRTWIPFYNKYILGKITNNKTLGLILGGLMFIIFCISVYIYINTEIGIVFFIILLILIVLSFVIDIIISHKIYKNVTSKYADILTVVNVLTLGLTRPIILFIIRNKYSKETK